MISPAARAAAATFTPGVPHPDLLGVSGAATGGGTFVSDGPAEYQWVPWTFACSDQDAVRLVQGYSEVTP